MLIRTPLAQDTDMNEAQFRIMMIMVPGVGIIPSPSGLNPFVVPGMTGEPMLKIAARTVPFVICMIIVVLLIAQVPEVSTALVPEAYK